MGLNAIKENYRGFKDMYFLQYHTLAAIHFMNHEGIFQIIRTIYNIYICLNHCWWCEQNKLKVMMKSQEVKGSFTLGALILYIDVI